MQMNTRGKTADRRARRSVQLLKQSFFELMREKGFSSMTIQDITDRADVNRGTFYAHFPDKYALLELAIREKFRHALDKSLPQPAGWDKHLLRTIVQTVLEHYKSLHGRCYPTDVVDTLFERAVQEELAAFVLRWLEQIPADRSEWRVPSETIASMISWAVFGAAAEWSRGTSALSAEQVADQVMVLLSEGADRLIPGSR